MEEERKRLEDLPAVLTGSGMDTVTSIKAIRATTGMSQQEFSEAFGIPKRTIENWESGVRKPPEYVINLLRYRVDKQ